MIDHIHRFTVPAAYALLPPAMASDRATAMLLAIGLHEGDGFTARKQYHGGPAHSFWQLEPVAVREVLEHARTKAAADSVVDALCYRVPKATIARQTLELWEAMTHNDTLAYCLARLNLWTFPPALAGPDNPDLAWRQYLAIWKPGAYTRGTEEQRQQLRTAWNHHYAEAWSRVQAGTAADAT